MRVAKAAIHSIRNDLTPILSFAEMALAGDSEAQKLVLTQLVRRTGSIRAGLDILTDAVRSQKRADEVVNAPLQTVAPPGKA
jgi:hypothetical protein